MKIIFSFLLILSFVSCASGSEKTYTGSTPAAPVIRSFLGISLKDSIDFIRWKIIISSNHYQLNCNYGIGKPNTKGFINGGLKIELTGKVHKEKNYYLFINGSKTLKAVELNENLLHLVNADNSLLVGTGGWSYTLNNIKPTGSDQISLISSPTILQDSMVFHGRTPCNVPDIIPPGQLCHRLKWYIVLYANTKLNQPDHFKILGTAWRKEGKTGYWKIIMGKQGRTFYQLNDANGNGFIYLLKLDKHNIAFTDASGNLLVGDEDFSYTLSSVVSNKQ
jgi:hypothetical protein